MTNQNMIMMPSPEQLIAQVAMGNTALSNFVLVCRGLLASGALNSDQARPIKDFFEAIKFG